MCHVSLAGNDSNFRSKDGYLHRATYYTANYYSWIAEQDLRDQDMITTDQAVSSRVGEEEGMMERSEH